MCAHVLASSEQGNGTATLTNQDLVRRDNAWVIRQGKVLRWLHSQLGNSGTPALKKDPLSGKFGLNELWQGNLWKKGKDAMKDAAKVGRRSLACAMLERREGSQPPLVWLK